MNRHLTIRTGNDTLDKRAFALISLLNLLLAGLVVLLIRNWSGILN